MKLYSATTIENGNDSIEIVKNSGKHVAWVPAHCFKSALQSQNKQVIVDFCGHRYGFETSYIKKWLEENCIEAIDLISAKEKFEALRVKK